MKNGKDGVNAVKQILTFKDGSFVLQKDGISRNVEVKVAVGLKDYADAKAARVLSRAFVKSYSLPTRPLPLFLDTHQVAGVKWALTRGRAYLAHAPGAGKTVQAIVCGLWAGGEGQVLFIVPPSLTANWEREVALWADKDPEWTSVQVIPTSNRKAWVGWEADFLICPDSMLAKPWVQAELVKRKFRVVAVDEASRFKESSSQRTIALFGGKFGDSVQFKGLRGTTRHFILLDGSPMPNRAMELWAPTYALSPESIDFMSQQDFGFRYCGAQMNERGEWQFKHSSREEELHDKLTKSFMHVVPESALKHPERRRSILLMNQDARSPAHKSWEQKHLSGITFSDIDENMSRGDMARFRQELGVRKAPWVARYVRERLETKNESILLFAWHREVCTELALLLREFRPGLVMGGTKAEAREQALSEFDSGKSRLIIGNIAAMGRGHNVPRADRVLFCEFSWSDELNLQCEKRASRRGRAAERPVRCEYVVSPSSMDEPILEAVFRKQKAVKRIIG